MRYRDAAALRRAITDRVRIAAGRDQQLSAFLRKRVAMHRLLARLLGEGSDRWVVKGGIALAYRLGSASRPTQDLDLACLADLAQARADLLAAQQRQIDDFFQIVVAVSEQSLNLQGRALVHRFTIETILAGTTFDSFKIDIAFAPVHDAAEPTVIDELLLAGTGLEPLTVPLLPLPHHISDKVHAYVRLHGPEGKRSSRPKDLIDLVLIQQTCCVRADELFAAMRLVLSEDVFPTALPAPPSVWGVPYRRLALAVGLDPDVQTGHRLAARFLDPALAGDVAEEAIWEPREQRWVRDRE